MQECTDTCCFNHLSNLIPSILKEEEVLALKAALQEKDIEIAGLKDERACGFVKVEELERALRPFQHLEFEQTWGGTVRISWCSMMVLRVCHSNIEFSKLCTLYFGT